MEAFCYTRTENEESAAAVRKELALAVGLAQADFVGFWWDALSGQRGLTTVLRRAESESAESKMIVVDKLSDLGKDVPSLVKQIDALLAKDISVMVHATKLYFMSSEPNAPEPLIIRALAQAHIHYVSANRKRGIASAREAGASIGRPFRQEFTLEAARKTIVDLTNADTGDLPTIRKLAKAIGCGPTKASKLLRAYKAEKELSKETGIGESAERNETT